MDSSIGIATRYGLDGSGIESQWGWDFPHSSSPALGPCSLLYNGYGVFPGGTWAGEWSWIPTPSSTEVKETVELYLYSLPGAYVSSYSVKCTLPLLLWCKLTGSGVPRGVWGFNLWQWRIEGGLGVQPPSEIAKALQNRAKSNPIVKTVKNCWI